MGEVKHNTNKIAGAQLSIRANVPLSTHDFRKLKNVIARADMREHRNVEQYEDDVIIISSKRLKPFHGGVLRIYGVEVRTSNALGFNQGRFFRQGREPINFNFEDEDTNDGNVN